MTDRKTVIIGFGAATAIAVGIGLAMVSNSGKETPTTDAGQKAASEATDQQSAANTDAPEPEAAPVEIECGMPKNFSSVSTTLHQNSDVPDVTDMDAWKAKQAGFMEKYSKQTGVMTNEYGLHFKSLFEGPEGGASPAIWDAVRVRYRGRLITGREFDASFTYADYAEFPLMRVIRGWTQGLRNMSVCDEYEFVIPAELAYGAREGMEDIPPNSTLVFEVQLLKVIPGEKPG